MSKRTLILAGFIIVKFFLQYIVISPEYDLQRDEFLHLDQANHPAWGYLSVPPVTSWISRIILFLGNSVFWVKFFPALFGALTIVVVWKAIEALGGNLFALVLGAACVLFSALLRLNTLFQPNSFDVLAWTSFYFVLINYFNTGKPKWLFIGALVFALGFLNKYNIVFLVIGFVPAMLITRQRKIFTQKQAYLAIGLALLLVLPNLLWQYHNHFPIVHHLSELKTTQLVNVDRIDFLKSQLLFFIGALFVILSGLYALLFYKPFKKYFPFFWSFFFTVIAFIYFRAKDYYAIGLYPIYISFGSVFLSYILKNGWKRYLQPVAIAIPVLVFIPLFNIAFPNKSPEYIVAHSKPYKDLQLLRWEDGKDHPLPQDFADMLGWKELAIKVDSIYSLLPNPEHTLILCDNYGQAGAINYYKRNEQMVATSFSADYLTWLRYDKKIVDAILVKAPGDKDKNRTTEVPLFDTVYRADRRINRFAREDTISIYVLKGAKADINVRIKQEADQRKHSW